MSISRTIINDIKNIIVESKNSAIRTIYHQRNMMYWRIGKRIFEEEQEGKIVQTMVNFLLNIFLKNWNRNVVMAFLKYKMKFSVSFTAHCQLRIHCIRN